MATREPRTLATIEEVLALPKDYRAELVRGQIIQKAAPTAEHGFAQAKLCASLDDFNGKGGRGPGSWWILTEADVRFEERELYRPDVAGWRTESLPGFPSGRPIKVRPDWVCEILSASNSYVDVGPKLRTYHRCKVPHYWVVTPDEAMLQVYRWAEEAYLLVLSASRGEKVRAEPFGAIELEVGQLFPPVE